MNKKLCGILKYVYADGRRIRRISWRNWGVGATVVRGQSKFKVTSVSRSLSNIRNVYWIAREV